MRSLMAQACGKLLLDHRTHGAPVRLLRFEPKLAAN
jgi:hypothetical protein